MQITPEVLPDFIKATMATIELHRDEVTVLDQVIGDGDHVVNLQRGLNALNEQSSELSSLALSQALQKLGMILLSTMGGASGSLFGTLFISMSKASVVDGISTRRDFADCYKQAVEAVKKRGKAEAGEKTMLDVLIPVAEYLDKNAEASVDLSEYLNNICRIAKEGVESTRDMLATKGRASYLAEKSIGHIDAGAKTSQLMICAIVDVCNTSKASN